MSSSIDNLKIVKKFKKQISENFPSLWESIVKYGWELRTRVPLLEPLIFKQLRKVSSSLISTASNSEGKKILFFQTRSNAPHLAWAGTLAKALAVRGHQPMFLGCSRELSESCNNANYPDGLSESRCSSCYLYTRRFFELSGVDTKWMGEYLSVPDYQRAEGLINSLSREKYEAFEYKGVALGQLARHSVAHYLRTGGIGQDDLSRDIYRKFLINSILVTDVSSKLLDEFAPDVVTMLGGYFMPEHVMMELAQARDIHVVTYEIAMLAQDALMIQHNKAIDYDDPENWDKYKEQPLNTEENRILDEYLLERSEGGRSVVNYWPDKVEDRKLICETLGIDLSKRTAILFPNITWDSALFEKDIAFDGMFDWLNRTIDFFIAHPEYQLIVRAHPAEVILPGSLRESVILYINKQYPALPENVILVEPESKFSSYAFMDMSQCGLSYASTTAMELGVRGIPTLVAGEVHFRRKDFTIDIDDASAYWDLLDNVMSGKSPLSREKIIEMARRYSYFTFFRTSMPFSKVHCGADDLPVFTYDDISELLPGKDRSLDIICSGITNGTPFIYE